MPEEVSHGLLQAYMPDFCEAVDLVISPSRGMEKILRRVWSGKPYRSRAQRRGAEAIPSRQSRFPRADFGFTEDDILLIYAGRIAPEKNLEFLLRSFAGVSQVIPNVYLLIIGGGQKEHVEDVKSLAQRTWHL